MTHTIKFESVNQMLQWLLENEIYRLPVDLTIHLEPV
jgi:hypothetical protein